MQNKKYGEYGGQYVAESLMNVLKELESVFKGICRKRNAALLCTKAFEKVWYKDLFKT